VLTYLVITTILMKHKIRDLDVALKRCNAQKEKPYILVES